MGLSGQVPGFILDGAKLHYHSHEPLFRELAGPWPFPEEAKYWVAAMFLPSPPLQELSSTHMHPQALTLGSHHGLGEGQGASSSYGCPENSLGARWQSKPNGEGKAPYAMSATHPLLPSSANSPSNTHK